jgi:RNA polymerase sigma-70 factor (ECF subfamily)
MDLRNRRDLEGVYRRYSRGLFNYILRRVGDHHRAEEILQETFLRAFARAETFDESARVSTWLYRIALNLTIDFLRARRHRQHASLDARMGDGDEATRFADAIADPDRDVLADASRTELAELVKAAVAELPDREQSVFLLRHYHEMTYREIARITGLSTRTVQNCVRRAHERLRGRLRRMGVGQEEVMER